RLAVWVAHHLCDQERQRQRLASVQAWVTRRLVASWQVDIGDVISAAEALGNIRTSKFKVDTAWVGTQLTVDLEEASYFIQDLVEVTGLVAIRGSKSIAVHRVRLPDHLVARVFHRAHNIRKHCADAVVAHTRDHRQATWLAVRIQFFRKIGRASGREDEWHAGVSRLMQDE